MVDLEAVEEVEGPPRLLWEGSSPSEESHRASELLRLKNQAPLLDDRTAVGKAKVEQNNHFSDVMRTAMKTYV